MLCVAGRTGGLGVNGAPESGPTRVGIPMVDIGTGISAAFAIMSAIYERGKSGRGQFLEVSLYDTAVSLLHPQGANWFLGGDRPALSGNAHPNVAPYDRFGTKTCDVFIGAGNDGQFARLCDVLGRPEMAQDPRFAGNGARNVNKTALKQELEALLADRDGEAVCMDLMARGVPAGPVLGVPEVVDHPHTRHRQMVVEMEGYRGLGNPIKMSRTPAAPQKPPPRFGEHTRRVLAEHGYGPDEIEALLREGVARETELKSAAE